MKFTLNENIKIDDGFKNSFYKNKEEFFKIPIVVSIKDSKLFVLDGAKRLMCLKGEFNNKILDFSKDLSALKLIKPCIVYSGSKPYSAYERAKIKHFELLNELEKFLDKDSVYYFFANLKRTKRAEIFLNFLDIPDLCFKLQRIYENKNPLVGYLYYRNIFKNKDNFYLFDSFVLNDIKSIKKAISNMHFHYQLDELNYYDNPNKIKYILSLFNMIKDDINFNYEGFKTTDFDLEHIKASNNNSDLWKNKLCNMLLLDAKTNRAYKDKSFEEKAKYITNSHLYASRAVFKDRLYGNNWDEFAAQNYLNDIKTTLNFIWESR